MAWRKLGLVFDLSHQNLPWVKSHAMLPTPLVLSDRIRVYYTARDGNGHSRIGFVDLSSDDPTVVLNAHKMPLLEVGKLGTFDDSGTLGVFAIQNGGDVLLYYNGYNRRVTVPWSNAVGVAVSKDGGVTFERMYEGPILDRNQKEPYFTITPWIIREGGKWHMWYTCGTGWLKVREVAEPLYVIKYAVSNDGLEWRRDDITCIPPSGPEEATARATVVRDGSVYKMWFIYRGSRDFRDGVDSYRIGYAESEDRIRWVRDDTQAGIEPSDGGWDATMQAYPAVVSAAGRRYLFYNGNGFGVSGFGCAVWE